ncbi:hypothetical protein [Cellulomonas denverensis]|uniref:hypothetical protein n=1 Tax=Cellulomonas denverensis TaxID=264297 RepID=UPI0035EBDF17
MRRTAAAIIAATLLLAGCASGGDEPDPTSSTSTADPSASADALAALDEVTVTGDPGTEPEITADWPFTIDTDAATVLDEGDGAEIADGQLVSLHLRAVSGQDGSDQGGTYSGTPQSYWMSAEAGHQRPARGPERRADRPAGRGPGAVRRPAHPGLRRGERADLGRGRDGHPGRAGRPRG